MMRGVQLRDGVMNVGAIARQLVCWGIGRAARWCCENGHLASRPMVQSVRISVSMMRALERLLGNWCAGASATQHGGAVRMDISTAGAHLRVEDEGIGAVARQLRVGDPEGANLRVNDEGVVAVSRRVRNAGALATQQSGTTGTRVSKAWPFWTAKTARWQPDDAECATPRQDVEVGVGGAVPPMMWWWR
ncbi:hypothetical protein QAD02_017161 [Eretmocerus hayati]|uniref:Uncharacterized protein n=1 Tax=Eretmocerus hayati TaxID=131215 RepID=A0ACC2PDJ2_9HYME|nr:hypothetical protein QAD02_017161 [Eretmocerus hayati]